MNNVSKPILSLFGDFKQKYQKKRHRITLVKSVWLIDSEKKIRMKYNSSEVELKK